MKDKIKVMNCCVLEDCESSEYSVDSTDNYKKFVPMFIK